jgi:hypothetical protein
MQPKHSNKSASCFRLRQPVAFGGAQAIDQVALRFVIEQIGEARKTRADGLKRVIPSLLPDKCARSQNPLRHRAFGISLHADMINRIVTPLLLSPRLVV